MICLEIFTVRHVRCPLLDLWQGASNRGNGRLRNNAEKRGRRNTRTSAKAASREASPEDSLTASISRLVGSVGKTGYGGDCPHGTGATGHGPGGQA